MFSLLLQLKLIMKQLNYKVKCYFVYCDFDYLILLILNELKNPTSLTSQ